MQSGRIAYLDCFSGISGDMFLGALLHAGLDEHLLREELARLGLHDGILEIRTCSRQSIGCKQVVIKEKRRQDLRTLPTILEIIDQSTLHPEIKLKSSTVFQLLAEAEAKVHGISPDRVHFHEIGALDTIFDIVGVIIGLHHLGISRIISSPLPLGSGFVNCDHGRLPLPAPAVCEILHNVPSYGVDIREELVTPTGAALVKLLADDFGPLPAMIIHKTGYGAGSRTLPDNQPNLVRILIGEAERVEEAQTVVVIETRLDDWNPESFPHICSRLLRSGALDVNLTSDLGKKGRPGFQLQVICAPEASITLQNLILSETTALGLRYRQEQRRTLPRKQITVPTKWGAIEAKLVRTSHGPVIYPEYEACRKTAEENNIPIQLVYRAIYAQREGE